MTFFNHIAFRFNRFEMTCRACPWLEALGCVAKENWKFGLDVVMVNDCDKNILCSQGNYAFSYLRMSHITLNFENFIS